MIQKITVKDFEPFNSNSTLEFKKLNLIIGKNGVGKTRLFKTINQGVRNYRPMDTGSAFPGMRLGLSIPDNGENEGVYVEKSQDYFSFMGNSPLSYHYIQDKRVPSSSHVEHSNVGQDIRQLEQQLFSNYLFDPECLDFTNEIYHKIFNRTIDVRRRLIERSNRSADIFSYKINGKFIDPTNDGFGIIQSLGIFQVLFLIPENSTVVIEEPAANLHPSAIANIMDEIISYAETKSIQLIIITHDIITALRFFHKISDSDKETTIHRFEQDKNITYIHNTDKDSITSMKDFLGNFPTKKDYKLLRDIGEFDPDIK